MGWTKFGPDFWSIPMYRDCARSSTASLSGSREKPRCPFIAKLLLWVKSNHQLLMGPGLMPAWSLSSPTVEFAVCNSSCSFSAVSFISGSVVIVLPLLTAVEIATRSFCIAFVYSWAHVNSAIRADFIGWVSVTFFPALSLVATLVASLRFLHNGKMLALIAHGSGLIKRKVAKGERKDHRWAGQIQVRLLFR